MKHNPFADLTAMEWTLYLASAGTILLAFFLSGGRGALTILASLIGVTSLIFVAKGYVLGQALMVVFAVFYGVISFFLRYYGEMITYLGMTAPIAVCTMVTWMRHPFAGTREVEVCALTRRQLWTMAVLAAAATAGLGLLLRAMGNANLLVSTVSITTSFVASYLTLCRSPYYAVGYAANDVVLIVLWTMAAVEDPGYWPMVVCFAAFFLNDLYGFYSWQRMRRRQAALCASAD